MKVDPKHEKKLHYNFFLHILIDITKTYVVNVYFNIFLYIIKMTRKVKLTRNWRRISLRRMMTAPWEGSGSWPSSKQPLACSSIRSVRKRCKMLRPWLATSCTLKDRRQWTVKLGILFISRLVFPLLPLLVLFLVCFLIQSWHLYKTINYFSEACLFGEDPVWLIGY